VYLYPTWSDRHVTAILPVGTQMSSLIPPQSSYLRGYLFLVVTGYVALLHLSYVNLIAPVWSYRGLVYAPAGLAAILSSWVLAAVPVLWMPLTVRRPSVVTYYLLYLFVVVPTCIVPVYTGQLDAAATFTLQIAMLLCFATLGAIYKLPLLQLPVKRFSPFGFAMLILVLSGICYGTILFFAGLPHSIPDLSEVYDVRAATKAYVGSNWIVGYAMDWQSNVVNPVLIGYGLMSRKLWAGALGILGQLLIYSIGGTKTVVFSILMLLCMFVVLRGAANVYLRLVGSIVMLVLAATVVDLASQSTVFTTLFVRRMIFIPGQLTTLYFDFFSTHPHALLGDSLLKGFVRYPYSQGTPNVIGAYYFGGSEMNANANLWADGFANFGYFGMLGATFLTALWLWLVDSSTSIHNRRLAALILCIPSLTLTDSGLLTDLASHGLALALVIMFVLPDQLFESTPGFRPHKVTRSEFGVTSLNES
jgi:hypothetical protein